MRVEYIMPDGTIQETFELADGLTLEQAARTLYPDTEGKFPAPVFAIVGDTPAVRELGDWDYPLYGAHVQFRALAMGGGGGGSNPLQMVMQIAIIAIAVAASVFVPGLGIFAATPLLGSIVGGLVGAGIMMLGTMLMGALFQQKLPSGQMGALNAAQASPTYNINSSGNQIRMYQVEPECFGRMKIVNDFVAQTWTQYIGNYQFGYFVYGIGRGRYEIESLQFGETVFWRNGDFVPDTGYEIEDIEFVEPGGKVTIFPDNVVTSDEVSGQELFAPNDEDFSGAIGPYTTNPPGTTTNKLLFDFVFQQGIGRYNDQGQLNDYTVEWRVDYRTVDDIGEGTSEWAALADLSYHDPEGKGTPTPQRLTYTYDVTPARYQVRVVRTSDTTGDGKTLDSLVWGALRAMLPGTYTYPISCIALSIKATNALTQGASQQFSSIVTRKLPLYDRATKTWSEEVPTRSWAAAVSSVCRSAWGGRLADSSIDLDTLWSIDKRLQAKGWNYDAYIDGAYLVWQLISEMCQSQCVIPRLVGPVLSFVEDRADRPATFALTPRNIVRNTFGVTYVTYTDDTPDDVTVEYLDADAGFQQRDVTATLPESESEEPASLSILGITNRDHAHDVAVAYAAHNRWQRIVVECQTEALGRIINKGDICTVAHPRFRNTAAGAVADWDESTLSLRLIRDMGKLYPDGYDGPIYFALSKPDGGIWGPCLIETAKPTARVVRFNSGDYSTLILQGQGSPFEWLRDGKDSLPTSWTAYTAREYQRRMIVDDVTSSDGLHYNLRLLNDDARIYQYDDLPTPPWQGRGQLPTYDTLTAPENVRGVVESRTSVLIVWSGVPGATWYDVELSNTGKTWASAGRATLMQMRLTVAPGKVYARVRAANDTMTSGWSKWQGDSTIPAPAKPAPTASAYVSGSASVSWAAVENAMRYAVSLQNDVQVLYSTTTTGTTLAVTPELQSGGPFRELSVGVSAVGANATSAAGVAELSDPAPDMVTDAEVEIGADSVTLVSVTPDESTDKTGYVIVRGDTADFGISHVSEMRQTASLPYVWGGLTPGVYYFRIAVKDGFYDIARQPETLNWSPVVAVTIEDA